MTLKTRKPTGAVPWPLILLEGGEKSGKTYACAVLTGSPKVGRSVWLDLNEGSGDEYGKVPGARYEVIEHDGSWQSILGQVADAKAEAQADADAGKPPFVLIVDTMTAEWDLLKAWAESRAKGSDFNKRKLAADANAEIQVPMNLWNDANSRHRKLMTILMTFPGIVVVTARGKEVAALNEKGTPIEGTKEYRVEGNKNLAFDCSCWVRMYRDKPAVIIGARSVHVGVRPGKDKPRDLRADWSLEELVFGILKCDPAAAHVRDLAEMRPARTPSEILNQAFRPVTDFAGIKELYAEAQEAGYEETEIVNEHQDKELLLKLLLRVGHEKKAAEEGRPVPAARQQARPAAVPPAAKPAEDEWVPAFLARLADSTGEDALGERRTEINEALAGHVIGARVASELHQAVSERSRETRKPVAA